MLESYDTIAVGSGVNSLVLACLQTLKGRRILVLEREGEPGGCMRTHQLTRPGYLHDAFAMSLPGFVSAPFFSTLGPELAKHGVEFLAANEPTAVLTPDGRALVLSRDRMTNRSRFDAASPGDGDALERAQEWFGAEAQTIFGMLGADPLGRQSAALLFKRWRAGGTPSLSDFGGEALMPLRDWLDREFKSDLAKALVAPWILHAGLDPEAPLSSIMGRLFLFALEAVGAPIVKGGISNLVAAMVRIIEEGGGKVLCNREVTQIVVRRGRATGVRTSSGDEFAARRAVVCSVTPQQLYGSLLRDVRLPDGYRERAARFRFGRGDMQIHIALSQPPEWINPAVSGVALMHLTSGLNAVSRAINEARRGLLPAEATIVVGQPAAVDPTRCPAGASLLWVQLQELPSKPLGDALGQIQVDPEAGWTNELKQAYGERILGRLEPLIRNFRQSVADVAILSPADLEKHNVNLVGGDPYSGDCGLDQFHLLRTSGRGDHRTPIKGLFHIGASTHPGPSLGAGSGQIVSGQLR